MFKKARISFYTFIAVFGTIFTVGAVVVPLVLNKAQRVYFELQTDVNRRHVRAMKQFVANRLQAGASREAIIEEFQATIAGTQTDRGYLCLIDQHDARYLCHPDQAVLGMEAKPDALFDRDLDGTGENAWQAMLKRGESGGGLLHYGPNMPTEIIYFDAVEGTGWTVSSHENAARINAEIRTFRRILTVGAILFGLLIALPASLAARQVGRQHERQVERQNELKRQLLEVEHLRKTQELEEARQLQLSMLPKTVPEHEVVELATYMKPATEVGGDYYDFDVADDGALTIAIGDATGHGLQASTMVTATKSLFNLLAEEPDLEHVLKKATVALKRMAFPRLYMALALGRLRGLTLELAGAGMPPALIYRAADQSVETAPLKGMPLGSMVDFPYQTTRIDLAPGDTVMLMSDGFPELFNSRQEMLGYDRARTVFEEVAHRRPEEIIAHFVTTALMWTYDEAPADEAAYEDDITFIVMKVKGAPPA